MTDLELAVKRSKRLERRLRDAMHVDGRGLHELTTHAQRQLPAETVKQLRYVATVRNQLVHDLDVTMMDDRGGFVRACDEIEQAIDDVAGPGTRDSWRLTIVVVVIIALFLLIGVGVTIWMIYDTGGSFELRFG